MFVLAHLLLSLAPCAPVTEDMAASAAVEAYRAADYEAAGDLWLSELASSDLSSPDRGRLLYNLGNLAFRESNVHEAVGWYTAALRYRPRDADTWANLEFARSEAGLEPADRGDLAATVERLLSAMTLAESEWAIFLALAIWAALLAGEALRGGRVWGRAAWGGLVLVGVSLAPWFYNLSSAGKHRVLVISDRTTAVLSEPRTGAARVAKAEAGSIIEHVDELPEWVKVRAEDGTAGWVERAALFDLNR
jgi:tetratricopeptide (TPR) repeat protein